MKRQEKTKIQKNSNPEKPPQLYIKKPTVNNKNCSSGIPEPKFAIFYHVSGMVDSIFISRLKTDLKYIESIGTYVFKKSKTIKREIGRFYYYYVEVCLSVSEKDFDLHKIRELRGIMNFVSRALDQIRSEISKFEANSQKPLSSLKIKQIKREKLRNMTKEECSYISGYIKEGFFTCETCWGQNRKFAMCNYCRENCHSTHATSLHPLCGRSNIKFKCDCGKNGHKSLKCSRKLNLMKYTKGECFVCFDCFQGEDVESMPGLCNNCIHICHKGHNYKQLERAISFICNCGLGDSVIRCKAS